MIVIVPDGCAAAYRAADQWKDFRIIQEMSTGVKSVKNSDINVMQMYDLSGRKLNEAQKGSINIVRMSDGTVKKVIYRGR